MHERGALLLNASFEPLLIVNWKKAITLLYLNKVEVVEEYPECVRSMTQRLNIPAVVRLTRMVKRTNRLRVPLTRKNVFLRDQYVCQYDGLTYPVAQLTVDHVVPRSQGGRSTWENLVTSCSQCNSHKGSKTLEQIGYRLLRRPKPPTPGRILSIKVGLKKVPGLWMPYLTQWFREEEPGLRNALMPAVG